jgi:phosphoserine phosphatase
VAISTSAFATVDPLASWHDTSTKNDIKTFVKTAVDEVPIKDRIAVFDMDGTVVCEKPLWIEMNMAQTHMFRKTQTDPTLIKNQLYKIAYDYGLMPNPTNRKELEAFIQEILLESYKNVVQETYVETVEAFIVETKNPDYKIPLEDTFYKPMVELIQYLIDNGFAVYIVSGSEDGLLWGVCKDTLPLERDQLIGTRLMLSPDYERDGVLVRGDKFYEPNNLNNGKTENIYYEIGKRPIFACGNTVDDFGMLSYVSTNNEYPYLSLLVNHDDIQREYKYEINDRHEDIDWEASVKDKNWHVISMKKDFKTIFIGD